MPKPGTTPTWATSGLASVIAPSAAKQAQGWVQGEKPPAGYLNWILYWVCQWIAYLAAMFINRAVNLAALSAITGSTTDDLCYVTGYGVYRLDTDSTDPTDGENKVPAAGGGVWSIVFPTADLIWAWLEPDISEATTGVDNLTTRMGALQRVLTGTTVYDFPAVATGATSTTTLSLPGAAVNDLADVGAPVLPAGVVMFASVTDADTVSLTLVNLSGSTYDAPSQSYRVAIFQF